jgi:hypothetical protein
MFERYKVYYDSKLIGEVMALHKQSAHEKGCRIAGVSASAYSGRAHHRVTVTKS